MIWTITLKWMTKLTGWIQQKAAIEKMAKTKRKHKVVITMLAPSQPLNNSLPPSINVSKQLGGQVGYPAHSQKGRPLSETSPKLDKVDGQEENKLIEHGLREINQIVAKVNERQRNLTTVDIQNEANWQLDNYLANYDNISPSLREIEKCPEE